MIKLDQLALPPDQGQTLLMHLAVELASNLLDQRGTHHIQVVYGPDAAGADLIAALKASLAAQLGLRVNLCGDDASGRPLASALAKAALRPVVV